MGENSVGSVKQFIGLGELLTSELVQLVRA